MFQTCQGEWRHCIASSAVKALFKAVRIRPFTRRPALIFLSLSGAVWSIEPGRRRIAEAAEACRPAPGTPMRWFFLAPQRPGAVNDAQVPESILAAERHSRQNELKFGKNK
jgi:hypothetical protein